MTPAAVSVAATQRVPTKSITVQQEPEQSRANRAANIAGASTLAEAVRIMQDERDVKDDEKTEGKENS